MVSSLAAALTLLVAQPATPGSPYLDAVHLSGPGREAAAVAALSALGLDDPDQVLDELDRRVCVSLGARSCGPVDLALAGREVQARVHETWRLLYPRALALHIEALGACDPLGDQSPIERHRVIVLGMIGRIERLAGEPWMPASFARLAPLGRHLLVWVLQYFRREASLALTLDWFDKARVHDSELGLAHGALDELRTMPDAVALSPRLRTSNTPLPRETVLVQEEARRLNVAVRTYEALLTADPDVLEAHLRVARLLLRLGRHDDAEPHLRRVADLGPDARQTYLSHLFMADVRERRGDRPGAIQAYVAARSAWPTAQSPAIALARLHVLDRDGAGARAALATVHAERNPDERTDPWIGYMGGQAWRLPAGLVALQASFEPLP